MNLADDYLGVKKAAEDESNNTLKQVAVGAVLLYLCTC